MNVRPSVSPDTARLRRLAASLATVMLLAACSVAPRYQRPAIELPAAYADSGVAEQVPADWWAAFGSPALDALIAQAMANNQDLRAAVARIEQARAALVISSSALLPSVSASGSASHSGQESGGDWTTGESDQWALGVGYQLDLWGANRAARDAALAQLDANLWNRVSVALTLQADVASTYFQFLALSQQLEIARQNLDAANQLLELVQVRFDAGAATALELAQQKTILLNISATIPSLQQQLEVAQGALAVLLGIGDGPMPLDTPPLSAFRLPAPATGAPARLLEQRPEIRIAEASLIAANADIAAARAALLPRIDLSLSAGVSGVLTGGTGPFASVAAQLAQTLFNGGALRAQVTLSEAAQRELTATYLQTVLESVQDVADSLSAQRAADARAAILEQTVEQANAVYRLAVIRFESGSEDLLTLLDAQRTRLSAEDSLVQARLARLTATADLFRALGGGWTDEAT